MAVDPTSGQLGSAALGSFGLGWPGPLSIQQARINSFTASNYGPVVPGTAITLTWSTTFATTVSISGIGVVAANGSMVVNPAATTTYILTASDGVHPAQTAQLTVQVTTPAIPVRSSQAGPAAGATSISVSQQVDLGDRVVVAAYSNTTNPSVDLIVSDDLGNIWALDNQGALGTFDPSPSNSVHSGTLAIWSSVITHAGVATITNNCSVNNSMIGIIVAEYTPPPGMAFAQGAKMIGDSAPDSTPPGYPQLYGTAPVNLANSLVITAVIGGFGLTWSSSEGDTKRQEIVGFATGFGGFSCAMFDAVLAGPGARNSNITAVPFDPVHVPFGFGNPNILVACYSAALVRPSTLDSQAAVMPSLSQNIAGYHGQPQVNVFLGYMPKIGSLVVVGAEAFWDGTAPNIPAFGVTDPYGHVYTRMVHWELNSQAAALFYTVVTALPATGVFTATVAMTPVNGGGPGCVAIAEQFINNLDVTQLQTAILVNKTTEGANSRFFTGTIPVTQRTLIAGFSMAQAQAANNVPSPFIPTDGYAIDTQWDTAQVFVTPLNSWPRMGTGVWFHKYVTNAGTYDGESLTTSCQFGGITIFAIPAPIVPSGGPLVLTCPAGVQVGTIGVFYTATLQVTGGTPPYHNFHVIAGMLPPGLTLHASTGVIDGTPTTAGTFTFTIEVSDNLGVTARVTCSITILNSFPIACPGVSTGNVGVPFSSQLNASGGTPPYTWVLIAGSLPPGLTLAASGLITGIPTVAGNYTYTVQATDSSGTPLRSQMVCMIVIGPALCYLPLWRQDEFAIDAFNTSWAQVPAVRPRAFSVSVTPPVSLQVAPVPLNAGVLDLCVVEGGPVLDPGHPATLLSVADDLAWAVVFGALSDLLSQDGQSRDPSRAAYCESRYQQAIEVALQLPSGLTTQVNNIPMNTGSVFDLDAFLPNWQCVQGRPRFGGYAGRNLLALGPVPDGVYGITADIVPNIPVPVNDNDFIQAGREDMAYILDYAQHLASFKMGGAEFTATMKLLKNFFAGAVMRNSRLKGTTVDKFDLDVPGGKQQLQYERTEGGSCMPTTNEGS